MGRRRDRFIIWGVLDAGQCPSSSGSGDFVLDLSLLEAEGLLDLGEAAVFNSSSINKFMSLGPEVWAATRLRVSQLLRHDNPELRDLQSLRKRALVPQSRAMMHLPLEVDGFADFYSSREHATNVGMMMRGKDNALQPSWLHMPIGYNGRVSTVVVSGTKVERPWAN